MKLHITSIEAVDEADDLAFTVQTFDSHTASIELKQTVHNVESWRELAADVEKALLMLNLETT